MAPAEEHKNNSRESICSHLLEAGNVQSFIDLFYISQQSLTLDLRILSRTIRSVLRRQGH